MIDGHNVRENVHEVVHGRYMKLLTEADILQFFSSFELSRDPKEAERLLQRIIGIAQLALIAVWNPE